MTKDELEQQIVDKKHDKLTLGDRSAILNNFSIGYAIPGNISDEVAKHLLELNLVKKRTKLPPGVILESKTGYFFELTVFGKKMKQKISIPNFTAGFVK